MTVTKAALESLRTARPKHNAVLHLRPDSHTVRYVHSSVEADRIGKLTQGDRKLTQALEKFRHDLQFSSREGQSKAQFNHQSQQPIKKTNTPQP
jgi:hypothetical protein